MFNDTIDWSSVPYADLNYILDINFISNDVIYSILSFRAKSSMIAYKTSSETTGVYTNSGWRDEVYKTIEITSLLSEISIPIGSGWTSSDDFLSWLQSNATKQEEEEPLPDIPTIPEGWRPINSGDLLRTFGTNLETALKLDFDITPTASSTSTLTFENGNVLFSSYNSNNELISYQFNRFMIESSSGGIFIYAQNEDTTISEQWYNANTGWASIFYGYALIVDDNTTIALNGNMDAFKWLYVKDKETSPTYSVNLIQGDWPDTQQISITNGLEYSINNGMTWFLIQELPLNLSGVSQIKFRNNTQQQSTFYISLSALGSPLYSLTQGQETANITIEEDINYYLGYIFAPSENMYFISGGYRFYNSFTISGNYNYALNFTFTFGTDDIIWNNIAIIGNTTIGRDLDYTNNSGTTAYSVFLSDTLTFNTMRFNTNYPIQYRYITFLDQYVDETTFNFLKKSGEFGVFSYPDESIDGQYDFGQGLLQGVNSFLAFEIFPGFSLLNLLQLTIAIPLLMYILKLFLGG